MKPSSTIEASINNHVNGWAGSLRDYFGLDNTTAALALICTIVISAFILFFVIRPIILVITKRIADRGKSPWIAAAYQCYVFHRIAWLTPGLVALIAVPIIASASLPLAATMSNILFIISQIYLVGVIAAVLSALLNAANVRFRSFKFAHKYSIKSYIQVLKLILFLLTAIIMVSIMIGRSPAYLLTGLGAMTAVGMLVFKDSIMGFVASIQLNAYDMIRIGDWVVLNKYGANGTVLDISLNTIKIQNFDKTIVTVPSYAILAEGVQNWRVMSESGGRRIKRHITININSVKLCAPELITKLSQLSLLRTRLDPYLQNQNRYIDPDAVKLLNADQKGLSNLTLYRLYLEAYLKSHPSLNTNPKMSFLVRELQNNNYGVPIEIYIFLNTTDWSLYESIQSDIFDYAYSIISLFELAAYQYESETAKGYEMGVA